MPFVLRGGYLWSSNDDGNSGFTGGIGWLAGPLEVDYAAYGAGTLGLSHLVTLRIVL
jgi:hypothetical protein